MNGGILEPSAVEDLARILYRGPQGGFKRKE
jgi:hypothetical protein